MRARLWVILAVLSGCEGLVASGKGPASTDPGQPGLPGTGTGGSSQPVDPTQPIVANPRYSCTDEGARGTTFPTLRRLTRSELTHTWSALVGAAASDSMVAGTLAGLPADDLQTLSTVSDAVPATWATTLAAAAKRSATVLLANPAERGRVLGACVNTAPLADACVQSVIATFGARVWRRDLDTAEQQALFAFYESSGRGEAGLGFLLRRLLQAPTLAFHLEDRGTVEGSRLKLSPFEVASRISYLTVGSMPDDALLAAARAGNLGTTAEVRAHVSRLLDSAAGRARVRDLMRYYLQLGTVSPPYAPLAAQRGLDPAGLGDELRTEALDFAEQVFFDAADGSFAQLMTSDLAVPRSERVARIFGATCASAAQPVSFGWNDASTFFHADGAAAPGPAVETLTQSGWFVWQLPAGRLTKAATQLRLEVVSTSADAVPLQLTVNLNDAALISNVTTTPGTNTLTASVTLAAGAAVKVGVHWGNAAAGRTLKVVSLSFTGAPSAQCEPQHAPSHPGLLHRPALLLGAADRTSPILRGAHVRKLFLCASLGMPDPNLVAARQQEAGDLDALSNRDRVTVLTSAAACTGCHGLINPLGFPFEAFDQAGMPRTLEQRFDANGMPTTTSAIDTSVVNPRLDFVGGPTSLATSKDLVNAMAQSQQARACFTQRAFEYLRRAPLDVAKDGCTLAAAEAKVKTGSLRDVLAELIAAEDVFFVKAP